MRTIYLDYNATTPVDPAVFNVMRPYFLEHYGNPSCSHAYGLPAREAVQSARHQIAALLHCEPDEVFFTGCGTEADNLALIGFARTHRAQGNHLIVSAIEHPAVLEACRILEREGFVTTYLRVDSTGRVDPDDLRRALTSKTILISIMHANNEVGTIQPLAELQAVAPEIAFHTDAAQSFGKVPIDFAQSNLTMLSLAGHKLYAPKGIGALIIRRGTELESINYGGGQERGLRSGTENVPHIVGLGKACELAQEKIVEEVERLRALRDRFWDGLQELGTRRNGHPMRCLPNTLNVSFRGVTAGDLLSAMPEIAASAGAACHGDSQIVSPVLAAMGIPTEWSQGTIRFSLGRFTTDGDLSTALTVITNAYHRLMH